MPGKTGRTEASTWEFLSSVDIPFEFVGEVSGARAVAEASHVEGGSTARHDELC